MISNAKRLLGCRSSFAPMAANLQLRSVNLRFYSTKFASISLQRSVSNVGHSDFDHFVNAVHNQQTLNHSSSMDVILETLAGMDEISLMEYVDKAHIFCYVSLKNIDEIRTFTRTRLLQVLIHAAIPPDKYEHLEIPELQNLVKNVMLVIIDKMSHRELSVHAARIGWAPMTPTRDFLREILRLWVQYPSFPLLKMPPLQPRFQTAHIDSKFLNKLEFYYDHEIHGMSAETISKLLEARRQIKVGPKSTLANRLIAFQEFIITRVFNEDELSSFLIQNHIAASTEHVSTSILRKRALIHLKCPSYSRYTARVPPSPKSNLSECDRLEILEESRNEALRLLKRIYHENPSSDPTAISQLRLKNLIPSSIRVDIDVLKKCIPIFSKSEPSEKLWLYEKDLDMKSEIPNIWNYVSLIAYNKYGISYDPQNWQRLWDNSRIKALNSPLIPGIPVKTIRAPENWAPYMPRLLSHSAIDKMDPESLKILLLNLNNQPSEKHDENLFLLKRLQDEHILNSMSLMTLSNFLKEIGFHAPRRLIDIRAWALIVHRFPFMTGYLPKASKTSREFSSMKDIKEAVDIIVQQKLALRSDISTCEINVAYLIEEYRKFGKAASPSLHPSSFMTHQMDRAMAARIRTLKNSLYKDFFDPLPFIIAALDTKFGLKVSLEDLKACLQNDSCLPWNDLKSMIWFAKQKDESLREYLAKSNIVLPVYDRTSAIGELVSYQDRYLLSLPKTRIKNSYYKIHHMLNENNLTEQILITRLKKWVRAPYLDKLVYSESSKPKIWLRSHDSALISCMKSQNEYLHNYKTSEDKFKNDLTFENDLGPLISEEVEVFNKWQIVSHRLSILYNIQKDAEQCENRWMLLEKSNFQTKNANDYIRRASREMTGSTKKKVAKRKPVETSPPKKLTVTAKPKKSIPLPRSMSLFDDDVYLNKSYDDIWERIKSFD